MPPSNVSRINFQPTLSPERRFITEKTFMGSIGKILVRYKECYWKQKLYSGEVLSDGSDCPITLVYDDTKAKQNGDIQPALIVFVGGSVYRYWIDQADLMEKAILKKLS